MTENCPDSITPHDYDYKTPDHVIIWLDDHIGDPEKYIHLKKSFSSNIDPRSQTWTMLTDVDYSHLIRESEATQVSFGGILVLLIAFTNPNACYAAFERYKDKRILFITSGTQGKNIIPIIMRNYPAIFIDSVTGTPYSTIYVFCGRIRSHVNWAMPYLDYILMFDHEQDLLLRMTNDMATYYSTKADRLHANGDLLNTRRLYTWTKKLLTQCQKMGDQCQIFIDEIDAKIENLEQEIRLSRLNNNQNQEDSDNDEKHGEACS